MRTSLGLLAAAAGAALVLSACGNLPPSGAAAVVGGTQIERDVVEDAVDDLDLSELRETLELALPADLQGPERRATIDEEVGAFVEDVQRRVLEVYVRLELIRLVAEEVGAESRDGDREEARDALIDSVGGPEQLGPALQQAGFSEQVFEDGIIEQEAALAAIRRALVADAQLDLREPRHILLDDEAAALEVLEELEAGADFAELASERSQDPGSAPQGGELEAAPRGAWLSEFDDAVWDAELGEVVGPIQTSAGFHVIEVVDIVQLSGDELPPEQVQQVIGGQLDELFIGVVQDTDIRIDPAFGQWNPDPNSPGIVPVAPVGDAPPPAPGAPGPDDLDGLTEEQLEELLEELEGAP